MNIFPTVAKNTLAQIAGRAVTILFSIALVALLTRTLGKAGYGAYAFITAFVLLFASISDWGTNIITVREASQKKERQAKIFGTVLLFRAVLATAALFLTNLVIRANPAWANFVYPATIASAVLLFLSLKTSLSIIFQTLLRLEKLAFVDGLSSALFFVFVVWALRSGGGLAEVMVAWVGAVVVAAGAGFYLARRLSKIDFGLDAAVIKKVFWEALPMGALLVIFSVYNRVDIVILQHFKGEEAVGIYGLAYKIHDNLVLGAAFLMNAIFPIISQSFSQKAKNKVRDIYQKTFDLLLLAAAALAGGFFIFSPLIVRILAGEGFFESSIALRILVFATIFSYFNHLTGYSLVAFGKQKISLLIGVVALLFNVLANFIFIPLFSWTAAAVITVATEGLVFFLSSAAVFATIGLLPNPTSFIKTAKVILLSRGKIF